MFTKNCMKKKRVERSGAGQLGAKARLGAVAAQLCVAVAALVMVSCQTNKMPKTIAGLDVIGLTTKNGGEIGVCNYVHGSVYLWINGMNIYVDPVTMFGTDYSKFPKADMILLTHEHPDHCDVMAIDALAKQDRKHFTFIYGSKNAVDIVKNREFVHDDSSVGYVRCLKFGSDSTYMNCHVMTPDKGSSILPCHTNRSFFVHDGKFLPIPVRHFMSLEIDATKAYNYTEGKTYLHPVDRGDVGFMITLDDVRIYIAGDTEDIPEMERYGQPQNNCYNIAVAFLPVNSYTMTAEQTVHAAKMLHPGLIIPYHGDRDNVNSAYELLHKDFYTVCQGCMYSGKEEMSR